MVRPKLKLVTTVVTENLSVTSCAVIHTATSACLRVIRLSALFISLLSYYRASVNGT